VRCVAVAAHGGTQAIAGLILKDARMQVIQATDGDTLGSEQHCEHSSENEHDDTAIVTSASQLHAQRILLARCSLLESKTGYYPFLCTVPVPVAVVYVLSCC
jgi:hypothetical protein